MPSPLVFKTFAISPRATIREKIAHVRKQIRINEILHAARKPKYYVHTMLHEDQMEELLATLSHLKAKLAATDPLSEYCESHPNDLECRIHD